MNEAASLTKAAVLRLMRPKSVAIVGASSTAGSLGGGVLANLLAFGFPGEIHLVNPMRSEIDGRPCLRSTRDLPSGVDCLVLAIPGERVMDALEGCAARDLGGAIIFSAGFAELGEEGKARQEALAELARRHGLAVAGPNCLGLVNFVDGAPLTFGAVDPIAIDKPGISLVSQSGAMATVVRTALAARELQLSFSISTGNEAVNGIEDFLAIAIEDPMTRVIGMTVEEFRQPRRFVELARRAAAVGKPIALLHPGRSGAARASARTHTGALVGDWEAMRAHVAREGVALVETLEELIDLCELFIRWSTRPSAGPAVITESGAHKAMVLDYSESIGLPLPQPRGATADALGALAPGLIVASNPLDMTAQALIDSSLYARSLDCFVADKEFGAVVLAVICPNATLAARKLPPIIEAISQSGTTKPVIFAMLGEEASVPAELVSRLRALGAPFFRSPERALRALARFQAVSRTDETRSVRLAGGQISGLSRIPAGVLPEYAAKRLLAAAGLPIPPGALVKTLGAALHEAENIGWPVAIKAQSPYLMHKSDVGGVALGLRNRQDLENAWRNLMASIESVGAKLDGVLVERMAAPGVELILGARRVAEWGPVLTLGLGGIFAELIKDVRTLPADAGTDAILLALFSLNAARLLRGYRGAAPRDVAAIAEAASVLGAFISAHPEISEIDVNPLMVYERGAGVEALDAAVVAD